MNVFREGSEFDPPRDYFATVIDLGCLLPFLTFCQLVGQVVFWVLEVGDICGCEG